MTKFFSALVMMLVLCTSAHAQLTGSVDGSLNRATQGFSVNLLAGAYQEETTGNFAFLPPKEGNTQIDTFYNYHRNGVDAPLIYTPGNIMVDFNGSVLNLTSYTDDVQYKTDHLYDFIFTAPAAGTYRFFSNSIPSGDFSAGSVNFVEKGFTAAPVPEASTSTSLTVLFVLGALAILGRRKSPTR
jgi:hypothetical protein